MIDSKDITGIILTGGKSSRMGKDKALLPIENTTFVSKIIHTIRPFTNQIFVVSNHQIHDQFNVERIEDCIADFGPVAAIYSGLKASKTQYNLIISCDSPLIDANVIDLLIQDPKSDLVMFQVQNRLNPINALYHQNCLPYFENAISKQQAKLMTVIEQINHTIIDAPVTIHQQLSNFNCPDDLKKLTL